MAEIFDIYELTGGSAVAISGDNFVVIAGDSRLSSGYIISSRRQDKLYQMTPQAVLASTGCLCDSIALMDVLRRHVDEYRLSQYKEMSTNSLANMVSVVLYHKRFLPYNISNLLAGLDDQGKGAVYGFDSIGHFERQPYISIGTAGTIMNPVLDGFLGSIFNASAASCGENEVVTQQMAEHYITEAFLSAAERDMFTGDYLYIKTITNSGISTRELSLPKD